MSTSRFRVTANASMLLAALLLSACDSNEGVEVIEVITPATGQLAPYEAPYLTEGNDQFESDDFSPLALGAATDQEIAQAQQPAIGGSWSEVLDWPLIPVSVANLPDGRVIAWSGGHPHVWRGAQENYHAIWNPADNQISLTKSAGHNMFCAGTAMTVDGEVMSVGGQFAAQSPQTSLFDWRSNGWTLSHEMNHGRWYPTTLSLPNGDIYTAMGRSSNQESSELWNPTSGWSMLNGIDYGAMVTTLHSEQAGWQTNMIWPYLQLAPSGKLFHAGPTPTLHWIDLDNEGSFEVAGQVPSDAYHITGTSLMYDAGKMIVTGGFADKTRGGARNTSTTAAFTVDLNAAAPVINSTGEMKFARKFHNAVMLPTGEMVVIGGNSFAGGFTDAGAVLNAEIWNPDTGQWHLAAAMDVPRNYHSTALLLTDGRVLAAGGGYGGSRAGDHADSQVWTPPYLYDANGELATRAKILSAPDHVVAGNSITVKTDAPVERFTFIRMASTTHQVNTDTRFVKLAASNIGDGNYQVDTPANTNVLLPGYWMLFAIDADGVPSISHVIKVKDPAQQQAQNIASQGTASQSSTYVTANATVNALGGSKAEKAIDGSVETSWYSGSVSATGMSDNPWWQVDLGTLSDIDSITLRNRSDCCMERLQNFYVFVSRNPIAGTPVDQLIADNTIWQTHISNIVQDSLQIDTNAEGRYVLIQMVGRTALALAEVEVFGKHIGSHDIVETATISTLSDDDWQRLDFGVPFQHSPVVIAGPPTNRHAEPVNVLLSEVSNSGFNTRLAEWDYQDGVHGPESFGLLAIEPGLHDLGGLKAWAGTVLVGSDWQDIHWGATFDENPVVLAQLASARGSGTAIVRTNAINGNGAWIRLQPQQAGATLTTELVHLLVVEKGQGSYQGRAFTTGQTLIDHNLTTIDIGSSYTQPVTLASVSTYRGSDPVSLRLGSSSNSQFQLQLQEETSLDTETAHVTEWVSWMAIDSARQPLQLTSIDIDNTVLGSASTFALQYDGNEAAQFEWNFGDGSTARTTSDNTITHQYQSPGRYRVTVKATLADGSVQNLSTTHVVARQSQNGVAVSSSGIVINDAGTNRQIWNVNPDNNSVSLTDSTALLAEIAVGNKPSALALSPNGSQVWVSNKEASSLSVISTTTRAVTDTFNLPSASQPHGLVFSAQGDAVFVALEASAAVAKLSTSTGVVVDIIEDLPARPRHLTRSHDGARLYVSHFITPPAPGESTASPNVAGASALLTELDSASLSISRTLNLAHSDAPRTEHSGPGLPNYLGAVALSPDGAVLYVPSKQDNLQAGELRSGDLLTHDQTVRAVSSHIDLNSGNEVLAARIEHDNASVAAAAVFDASGIYLFTALEGNREIAVSDTSSGLELFRFDTGLAPQSLALSDDQTRLYVHNFMDRSIGVYDVTALLQQHETSVASLTTIQVVDNETLSDEVLRGKQLFYDARDERLALDKYMSCASCHNEGDHDGRVWDMTQFGEGLRNTISLRGKGIAAHGLQHWTGNFDEVQDFEGQIRDMAGGTGLMTDADFNATAHPLGTAKTGRSADLDALAAYLASLQEIPASPLSADTAAVNRGRTLFNDNNCASCHSGDFYTDSATEALHDIGTIKPASGQRLDNALTGLDTPSLLGLHETAPYLHDGSAATVAAAIDAHSQVSLSAAELADLSAYVLQLTPGVEATDAGISNPVADGSLTIDGHLGDWASVQSFGSDPADISHDPEIDWRQAWMAHDSSNYYLAWQNDSAASESWGYGVYIDIDDDPSTGFRGFLNELPIGADYLLEWGYLISYTGSGSDWSWQDENDATIASNGDTVELQLPFSSMPVSDSVALVFRGDNGAIGQTGVDYFPDAATDSTAALESRLFQYTTNTSPANRAPVALSQQLQTQVNNALALTLQGADVDGDTLSYQIEQQPSNGQLSGTAPGLSYQPNTDYIGADTIVFTVSDGTERSANATVHITVYTPAGPTQAVSNFSDSIVVDAELTDWSGITPLPADANETANAQNPLDWQQAWLAHSNSELLIAYRNHGALDEITWGQAIYLDTDTERTTGFTGFGDQMATGADYLVEGDSLFRYTGAGNNWQWEFVQSLANAAFDGEVVELSVPVASIGSPTGIDLYFKSDNAAHGGTLIDLYPDAAASDLDVTLQRFFRYRF